MLEARRLTERGAVSGTVVWADYQSSGRGRITERRWESMPGDGLLFTVIYDKADLSGRMKGRPFTLLPLLCGLAVSEAVAEYLGRDADIRIKWPNDVLAGGRKLCGILCEASGDWVYAGIGINLNQVEFHSDLRRPACSIRQLSDSGRIGADESRRLLEMVLDRLNAALENNDWQPALNLKLYKSGESVRMKAGLPEEFSADAEVIEGRLAGINNSGALLIENAGGTVPVISGELLV